MVTLAPPSRVMNKRVNSPPRPSAKRNLGNLRPPVCGAAAPFTLAKRDSTTLPEEKRIWGHPPDPGGADAQRFTLAKRDSTSLPEEKGIWGHPQTPGMGLPPPSTLVNSPLLIRGKGMQGTPQTPGPSTVRCGGRSGQAPAGRRLLCTVLARRVWATLRRTRQDNAVPATLIAGESCTTAKMAINPWRSRPSRRPHGH